MQCHIHLERSVGERKFLLKGLANTSYFIKCLFFGFGGGWGDWGERISSSLKILCVC